MMSDRNASRSNELDLNRFELEGSVLRIIITAAAIAAATRSVPDAQMILKPARLRYAVRTAAAPPNTSQQPPSGLRQIPGSIPTAAMVCWICANAGREMPEQPEGPLR